MPGLIASTALQVAIGESTWPVFSNFQWIKTYFAQGAAPLRVGDILAGHLAFVLFRVLTTIAAFLLVTGAVRGVALAVGGGHPAGGGAARPGRGRADLRVRLGGRSDSWLAMLFRFAVIPMTLFAGVFFPVESLPAGAALAGVRDPALARRRPVPGGHARRRSAVVGRRSPALPRRLGGSPAGCWPGARFRRQLVV